MSESAVTVGRILGVFGVLGWVKVQSYTRPPQNILRYRRWQVNGVEMEVEDGRPHGPGFVAKLRGVEDRDRALALQGSEVTIDRGQLPPPEDDEVYWVDLMGSEVVSVSGAVLGTLVGITENGAQDVMIVRGDVERLIPFVPKVIVEQVLAHERKIVVHWEPDY